MRHPLFRAALVGLLVAAASAPLAAQFGNDPITSSSALLMAIILQAVKYLGVAAIAFAGARFMFGRGDSETTMNIVIGGAMAFGAALLATALFPGLAP